MGSKLKGGSIKNTAGLNFSYPVLFLRAYLNVGFRLIKQAAARGNAGEGQEGETGIRPHDSHDDFLQGNVMAGQGEWL